MSVFTKPVLFESIHNHHERAVCAAVRAEAANFPHLSDESLLADIACVALNRLPARYIRHPADFSFYLSDRERKKTERDIGESVRWAFEYVQARAAMRARG